eukprot:2535399-Alexandrium_andersonii.AAC.1
MPTASLPNVEAGQAPKPPAPQGALGCVASVRAAKATHTANSTPRATAMAPIGGVSQGEGTGRSPNPLPGSRCRQHPNPKGAERGWAETLEPRGTGGRFIAL